MIPAASAVAPASGRVRLADLVVAAAVAVVLVLLAVFVVWPVLRVLAAGLATPGGVTMGRYVERFVSWPLLGVLVRSVGVAAVSATVTVALALVVAYTVTRTTVPGRRLIARMSLLPLLAPPFLASLGLLLLLGRNGAVVQALGAGWSIEGFPGIVLAQIFTFLPHAYLLLTNVLGGIDSTLDEVAESLGASTLTTLRRVTLALAAPGLASAALLVFILSMTDFGNPMLVGGSYGVLTTEVFARVTGAGDVAGGATMTAVLMVPCLAAYLVNVSWLGSRSYLTPGPAGRLALRPTPPALAWPCLALAGAIALAIPLLYGLVPLGSLVERWGSDWTPSLRHYAASPGVGVWPVWNSLRLAAGAGVAGTALALGTAYVVERRRPPAAGLVRSLGLLPAALPGTAIGLGYALAFGVAPGAGAAAMWVLVASVVFREFPVAQLAAIQAVKEVEPAAEEAAEGLGASSLGVLRRVVMPLLTGGALSIFVYFFVNGMVTVTAVVFLVPPGSTLASVAMLGQAATGTPGAACALATIVVAIVAAAALLLRALSGAGRAAILKA